MRSSLRAGDTPTWMPSLIMLFLLSLVSVFSIAVYPDSRGVSIAFSSFYFALVLLSFRRTLGREEEGWDFSDPLGWVSSVLFILFGARSVVLAFGDGKLQEGDLAIGSVAGYLVGPYHVTALIYSVIASTTLVAGYRWGSRLLSPRVGNAIGKEPIANPTGVKFGIVLSLAVGWVARFIYIQQQGFRFSGESGDNVGENLSALTTLVQNFSRLTLVSLAILVVHRHLVGGWHVWATWIIAPEIAFQWIQNARMNILATLLVVVIGVGLSKRVRPRAWMPAVALLVLIVISVSAAYRRVDDQVVSASERTQLAISDASGNGLVGLFVGGIETFTIRYHGVDSVAAILAGGKMPVPRFGLSTLESAIAPLIPRFLWPSKPTVEQGTNFAVFYFSRDPDLAPSMIPTWYGDILLQFPTILLPAITLVIGSVLGAIRLRAIGPVVGIGVFQIWYLTSFTRLVSIDGWLTLYVPVANAILIWIVVVVMGVFPNNRAISSTPDKAGSGTPLVSPFTLEDKC